MSGRRTWGVATSEFDASFAGAGSRGQVSSGFVGRSHSINIRWGEMPTAARGT